MAENNPNIYAYVKDGNTLIDRCDQYLKLSRRNLKMKEEVFDFFSANSWAVVKKEEQGNVIKSLELDFLSANNPFSTPLEYQTGLHTNTVLNSLLQHIEKVFIHQLNDWLLLEGKCFHYLLKKLGITLSKKTECYIFDIDIWSENMSYSYFLNEERIRYYQMSFENGIQIVEDDGEMLSFEKSELTIPESHNGYNELFYPLAIMDYLGIKENSLDEMLRKNASLYKISKDLEKIIHNKILKENAV